MSVAQDTAVRPSAVQAPSPEGGEHRWFPPGTHITVRGLRKFFGATTLYDGFDLDVPRGRITSVFGPNGCGKSTLINMMAGILPIDGGEILFDGKTVRDTRIGYVFQNYREAVFPWLRAIDNIRYPLKFIDLSPAEKAARVEKLIASFDVKIDLNRYPYELSGGQQQLVSIMRALVVEPEVLFLDEPFSALDYEMTLFMRDQLQRVFMERQTTTLLVSHDLEEAVYLADHVLLLTRKPTRAAAYLPFDALRPRDADTLSTPEFVSAKKTCLDIFTTEVRKP
jgi:NitT/TauT family transport system ATP-binding protein